jgi:carbamoyl-phosphate synthase small subunit
MKEKNKKALIMLEDGSYFHGKGFGALNSTSGEIVFSTSMVGYPESLTDPSYNGQILVLTYPLIGNYGVPSYENDEFNIPLNFESIGIKVNGLVIQELCLNPHHWASKKTLDKWLTEEGIPGIYDLDTRQLTKKLRERGVMLGILKTFTEGEEPSIDKVKKELKLIIDPNKRDLVKEVTIDKPIFYDNKGKKNIVLIDCGVKASILRNLMKRKINVIRVPYDFNSEEILDLKPDGVIISNGPGDPQLCKKAIYTVRKIILEDISVMGICLGNQILALSLNGKTFKLKYGHRSQNQPAYDVESGLCYITTQNHGYAVDPKSIENSKLKLWFINANDKTVEGIRYKNGKTFAVQWHPEASPGPYDTEFLFDYFIKKMG